MNSIIEEELPGIHELRDGMMGMISDEDLSYKLPGNNPTLGELCVEWGRFEQIYSQSFKTFNMDWHYAASMPDSPTDVKSLDAWFKTLDAELHDALSALSEEDIHTRTIERGHGFTPTAEVQFKIYHEALLMFYAKASVYLKALEKDLNAQWRSWIG